MGQTTLLPFWRKACWGFFRPEKSDGFGRVWTRERGFQRPASYLKTTEAAKATLVFHVLTSFSTRILSALNYRTKQLLQLLVRSDLSTVELHLLSVSTHFSWIFLYVATPLFRHEYFIGRHHVAVCCVFATISSTLGPDKWVTSLHDHKSKWRKL